MSPLYYPTIRPMAQMYMHAGPYETEKQIPTSTPWMQGMWRTGRATRRNANKGNEVKERPMCAGTTPNEGES